MSFGERAPTQLRQPLPSPVCSSLAAKPFSPDAPKPSSPKPSPPLVPKPSSIEAPNPSPAGALKPSSNGPAPVVSPPQFAASVWGLVELKSYVEILGLRIERKDDQRGRTGARSAAPGSMYSSLRSSRRRSGTWMNEALCKSLTCGIVAPRHDAR